MEVPSRLVLTASCLNVLPWGKSSVEGQVEATEVFAPIRCGRKLPGHF